MDEKDQSERLEAARALLPENSVVRVKKTGIVTWMACELDIDMDGEVYVDDLFGYPYAVREQDLERVTPEELKCQRCSSSRLLLADFEALPGFDSIPATIHLPRDTSEVPLADVPFAAPHALNPQHARAVGFIVCADCGQMQGQWPLNIEKETTDE